MRTLHSTAALAALALAPALADAGTKYEVRVQGTVEFNSISTGPLGQVQSNDAVVLTFLVDSDQFVDSPSFPTRGYVIDQPTWDLQFPGGSVPLQNPWSGADPLFVIRNNDPGVDGFYIADNVNFPTGVPLDFNGAFGPFVNNFSVTYGPDLTPTLDIADVVGAYQYEGLSVFNWTIDDGPFNPLGINFEEISITEVLAGSTAVYGCGTNPAGSIAVAGGSPSIGDTLQLAVDNPLGTQAAGSIGGAFVGFAPAVGFPCGLPVPGLGMSGPGALGEVLVDGGGPSLVLIGTPWGGTGSPSVVDLTFPGDPVLVGVHVYAQGFIVDPLASLGVGIGLADAVDITIGS